jgi:hypothetical protein
MRWGMRNKVTSDYARVWHRICIEWLGWREKRFERFLNAYNAYLVSTNARDWFYHDVPLYHIIPLLLTDAFEERLHKQVRNWRYGTPEYVFFRRELVDSIEGGPNAKGRFDWPAAKKRAEEHLALYREKFPSRKTVTSYEKWLLSFEVAAALDKALRKPS